MKAIPAINSWLTEMINPFRIIKIFLTVLFLYGIYPAPCISQDQASNHYENGLRYLRYAVYDSAVLELSKAIVIDRRKPVYRLERARAYLHLLKISPAGDDLTSTGIDSFPEAAYYRGLALVLSEEFDAALKEFQIAEQNKIISASSYYWGLVHYNAAEFSKAANDFSDALEGEFPYVAYFLRGRTYMTKGDLDIAIGDFSRMMELKPDFAPVYRFRASVYEKKGDKYRARLDRRKAEELSGK